MPRLSARHFWWRRVDSNHRSESQQIYSLPPLATRELLRMKLWSWWTDSNPRPADYKSAALPTELHQRFWCLFLFCFVAVSLRLLYNTTGLPICQHFFQIFFEKFPTKWFYFKKLHFPYFCSIFCTIKQVIIAPLYSQNHIHSHNQKL